MGERTVVWERSLAGHHPERDGSPAAAHSKALMPHRTRSSGRGQVQRLDQASPAAVRKSLSRLIIYRIAR